MGQSLGQSWKVDMLSFAGLCMEASQLQLPGGQLSLVSLNSLGLRCVGLTMMCG